MRLTKKEHDRLVELSEKCDELQTELIEAIDGVRSELSLLVENEIEPAQSRFNKAISELEKAVAHIADRIEDEAGELDDVSDEYIDAHDLVATLRDYGAELSAAEIGVDGDAGIEDHIEQSFELPEVEVEE